MSLSEAKARFRAAASAAGPEAWVRAYPRHAMLGALLAGIAVGARPAIPLPVLEAVLRTLLRP